MCLAISAANKKGNISTIGQLHNLPVPNTVYIKTLTENKFKDYDKHYEHVQPIVDLIENNKDNTNNKDKKDNTKNTNKKAKTSKNKKNNNMCNIQ